MGITYYNLATYYIRVGLYMSNKDQFEEYCRIIEEYSPCMDDYPYVIDIASDTYYFPEIDFEFCFNLEQIAYKLRTKFSF